MDEDALLDQTGNDTLDQSTTSQDTTDTNTQTETQPAWAAGMATVMERLVERVNAPAAAPVQQRPTLTPEQIQRFNAQITQAIVEGKGLEVLAPLANQIAGERLDSFREEMTPYVQAAVDSFVDRFRSDRKDEAEDKGQVKLYREISKQFNEEIKGEDLSGLAGKSRADQDRLLSRFWKAATGEVLSKKVQAPSAAGSARPAGSSAGSGGELGSSAASRGAKPKLDEVSKRQLYRSMKKEVADKYIAEIEEQLAASGGE